MRAKGWDDYPAPLRDPSGCLRWQGPHSPTGYGRLGRRYAHRVAWEREVGPIPNGLSVDHVRDRGCVWRDCVEVTHLEPITQAENLRRAARAITSCPAGHEYV